MTPLEIGAVAFAGVGVLAVIAVQAWEVKRRRKQLRDLARRLMKERERGDYLEEKAVRLEVERDTARTHLDRWRARRVGARPGGSYEDVKDPGGPLA